MMKIKDQARCYVSQHDFYTYCRTLYPKFYKKDRTYLKVLCDTLQEFYYNDNEFMLINLPPRHGKSFTATNFAQWVLGKNPKYKIITGSYNEDVSKIFSKQTRDAIERQALDDKIVYSDIFKDTKIKYGSAAVKSWQTEESDQVNYLATSPTGTSTGFGADLEIIDDLIKDSYEANNENILEKHWDWFTNTMLSRREGKKKVLIIMTRWSSKDLAGKIIDYVTEEGISYSHVKLKALNDGKMLCDDIFNKSDYDKAKKLMGEDIFNANYDQEPMDLKGALYSNLKTYDETPVFTTIDNYTDTADEGKDYLCSISYGVYNKQAYILDVVYTKSGMEVTEPLVAKSLLENNVNYCRVESNNGGRGFSRNVERETRALGNRKTTFKPFPQSKNKISRILSESTNVMNDIFFPKDWRYLFPDFYKAVTTFQREGKNANDDAPDTLTGIVEVLGSKNKAKVLNRNLIY